MGAWNNTSSVDASNDDTIAEFAAPDDEVGIVVGFEFTAEAVAGLVWLVRVVDEGGRDDQGRAAAVAAAAMAMAAWAAEANDVDGGRDDDVVDEDDEDDEGKKRASLDVSNKDAFN